MNTRLFPPMNGPTDILLGNSWVESLEELRARAGLPAGPVKRGRSRRRLGLADPEDACPPERHQHAELCRRAPYRGTSLSLGNQLICMASCVMPSKWRTADTVASKYRSATAEFRPSDGPLSATGANLGGLFSSAALPFQNCAKLDYTPT